jgi:hypothetical protein
MLKLEIKEITDLEEAEKIWNEITPGRSIYDNWDFRYCFYKYSPNPLHFFAGYSGNELVGLLPLEYIEEEGGYLGFFAEDFMEDNRLFIKPGYEKYTYDFYRHIKTDVMIDDLAGEDIFTAGLPLEDYKYVLPLSGLKSFRDHLEKSFSSKRRRQFLKARNIVENKSVNIIRGEPSDIDLLFDLNIRRHGEESYLKLPHKREIFKELAGLFDVRVSSYAIGGKKEGAAYAIFYKGVYNYLSVGANLTDHENLGAFIGMDNIDFAISLGAEIFDAGLGDCGWKSLWHFNKISQYSYYCIGGKIRREIN